MVRCPPDLHVAFLGHILVWTRNAGRPVACLYPYAGTCGLLLGRSWE